MKMAPTTTTSRKYKQGQVTPLHTAAPPLVAFQYSWKPTNQWPNSHRPIFV